MPPSRLLTLPTEHTGLTSKTATVGAYICMYDLM